MTGESGGWRVSDIKNTDDRLIRVLSLAGWPICAVAWLMAVMVVWGLPALFATLNEFGAILPPFLELALSIPNAVWWSVLGLVGLAIVALPFVVRDALHRILFQMTLTLALFVSSAFAFFVLYWLPLTMITQKLSAAGQYPIQ